MRWIPGGVLSTWWTSIVKNSVRGKGGTGGTGGWNARAPDAPDGTNNSRGSERGPTSFQKYVRESCGGSPQWNTEGERAAMPLLSTCYPILFMSEYSKTLCYTSVPPCHSAGPPPTRHPSACFSRSLSFKHSPAILAIPGNAKPSVIFTCIYRVVRENVKRARRHGRSERNALWRSWNPYCVEKVGKYSAVLRGCHTWKQIGKLCRRNTDLFLAKFTLYCLNFSELSQI